MGPKEKIQTIRNFLKTAGENGKPKKANVYKSAQMLTKASRHGGSLSEEARITMVRKELKGYDITPSLSKRTGKHPSLCLRENKTGKEIII